MRIHILAVGRAKSGPLQELYALYARRLTAWPLSLREVEEKRRLSGPQLQRREGELLRAAIPAGAVVVALDEHGKSLSSANFAERLNAWSTEGTADLAFLIGGADGLDDATRHQAHLLLSLGALTWPHMLVRPLLVEQLYRAQCILGGHPYHRV